MHMRKLIVAVSAAACILGTASVGLAAGVGPQVGPAVGPAVSASPQVGPSVGAGVGPGVGPAVGGGTAAAQPESTWSYDEPCADCHATQAASLASEQGNGEGPVETDEASSGQEGAQEQEAQEACPSLALTHAAFSLECKDCHADEEGLTAAHAGATAELAEKRATKLRDTRLNAELCLACHQGEERLAEATAELDLLTDARGRTVNPHAVPDIEAHESIDCSSCHKFHSDEPAAQTASELCLSCHHDNVYACHTCHD